MRQSLFRRQEGVAMSNMLGIKTEDVRQRTISAVLDIIENYDHHNIGVITDYFIPSFFLMNSSTFLASSSLRL